MDGSPLTKVWLGVLLGIVVSWRWTLGLDRMEQFGTRRLSRPEGRLGCEGRELKKKPKVIQIYVILSPFTHFHKFTVRNYPLPSVTCRILELLELYQPQELTGHHQPQVRSLPLHRILLNYIMSNKTKI